MSSTGVEQRVAGGEGRRVKILDTTDQNEQNKTLHISVCSQGNLKKVYLLLSS